MTRLVTITTCCVREIANGTAYRAVVVGVERRLLSSIATTEQETHLATRNVAGFAAP